MCAGGMRERQRLVKERTEHGNWIKGLLKTQGIMDFGPRAADAVLRLDALVTGDGRPLGPWLKHETTRELERPEPVMRQMTQVEAERDAVVRDRSEQTDMATEPTMDTAMIVALNRLKGIGMNDATILAREASGGIAATVARSAAGAGLRRHTGRADRCRAARASPKRGRRCCEVI